MTRRRRPPPHAALIFAALAAAAAASCPPPCFCKWKAGKRAAECPARGLTAIPPGIDPQTQLLDLSGNQMPTLLVETFLRSGLLDLQRLLLPRCHIAHVDQAAFRGLANLVLLDLSDNFINEVPSVALRDTPFLRDLLLAGNHIDSVGSHAFTAVPGLATLDLARCRIRLIAADAFDGIPNLETLKLDSNRLERLDGDFALNRLRTLSLHDNPWHCDCHLRAARIWLARRNVPLIAAPACAGPDRLARKSLATLDPDDLACRPEVATGLQVTVAPSANATLVCRVRALPPASVAWLRDGHALPASRRLVLAELGTEEKAATLVLRDAREADAGRYQCVAENRAGHAEAEFELRVTAAESQWGVVAAGLGAVTAALAAAAAVAALRSRRGRLASDDPAKEPQVEAGADHQGDPDLLVNAEDETAGYRRVVEDGLYPAGWPPPGDPFPADYGLPLPETASTTPSAKTLRVWQRGVPVLPPLAGLLMPHYQQATDV